MEISEGKEIRCPAGFDSSLNGNLNPSIELLPSDIHGNGLFAKEDIEKGTPLHATHIHKTVIGAHHLLNDWICVTPNNLYNHSKENANCKIVSQQLIKILTADRNIESGEELLADYTETTNLEQPEDGWKK
jgi:SET domain-containing protein